MNQDTLPQAFEEVIDQTLKVPVPVFHKIMKQVKKISIL